MDLRRDLELINRGFFIVVEADVLLGVEALL
jgi:hypothetical protein